MGPELKALVTAPEGQGGLTDPTAGAEGDNPVCGDRLRIEMRVVDGRVAELGFRANACAATIAVASCAARVVPGAALPITRPVSVLRSEVARLGGLTRFEQHALALVEDVLVRCADAS